MAIKAHRETLNIMQRFWQTLLHKKIKFRSLAGGVQALDASIRQTERVYRRVLQRHSSSVQIVRLYAKVRLLPR
jgi:hypothetical protein